MPTCENSIFQFLKSDYSRKAKTSPFLQVLTRYPNQDSYSDPTHFQVEGSEIGDLQEVRGYPVNSTTVVIVWDRPAVAVDVRDSFFHFIDLEHGVYFLYSLSTLLIPSCIFSRDDTFFDVFSCFVNDLRVDLKTDLVAFLNRDYAFYWSPLASTSTLNMHT